MLLIKDTTTKFGFISVALHWINAFVIFFLFPTGLVIMNLSPRNPLRNEVIWWHMSIAVLAVPFFLFRIFWRVNYDKPKSADQHWTLKLTADVVWRLILVGIFMQIFTGPLLWLSHGYPIHTFGFVIIPNKFPGLKAYTWLFHPLHIWTAITIASLVGLHAVGAIKHWLIDRDGILQRMLWPVEPDAKPMDASGQSTAAPATGIAAE